MIYLLDTNIISALMRRDPRDAGDAAVLGRIAGLAAGTRLCASIVVQCELQYGLQRNPSARLQRLFDEAMQLVEVLPLDASVASHYADLRCALEAAGKPIGANDSLIAAHALALGATLVSADTEFARVPGVTLQNWLTP